MITDEENAKRVELLRKKQKIGTSGTQIGWLASQADMLSNDWYIVY